MFFTQITLLFFISAITLCSAWLLSRKRYWSKRRIPCDIASFSYLGRKVHSGIYYQRIYEKYKNKGESFVGVFRMFEPAVLPIDLELVKRILITDFEYFPHRGLYHDIENEPISANIVRLQGEPWRRLRTKLTPTFTSGKMKYMFPTVVEVGQRFTKVLTELLQEQQNVAVFEMRELCARFTTDVVGSVAFGIECNSLKEPNTKFHQNGEKALKSFSPLKEFFAKKYPQLARRLGVRAFPQELNDFYTKLIVDTVAHREEHQIRRNDFLDILLELKKAEKGTDFALTLDEIIAQSFVFFIAGSDSSSNTMALCLYELSKNVDLQQKARLDVMNSLGQYNGQLSYECIKEMKYLEQAIAETMRKYPFGPNIPRVTAKDYIVPHTKYVIERNTSIIIPVYGIHHDPAIYPNPYVFDPERFAPSEIQKRHPMSYLPFGAGPRICIAERFGRMQVMIGMAMLLRYFSFTSCVQTPKKLEFDPRNFRTFSVKGGIHLNVQKI